MSNADITGGDRSNVSFRYQPDTAGDDAVRPSSVFENKLSSMKPSISNLPDVYTLDGKVRWEVLLALGFAGLVYGGIHFAAWNSAFPSVDSRNLWRFSGIVVAISGLVLPLVLRRAVFKESIVAITNLWTPVTMLCCMIPDLLVLAGWLAAVTFPVVYVVARAGIVVESYVNLKYAPPEVFRTVTWAQYVPHI